MNNAGALFIHAITGLHPGSGTSLGVVDMPVQRERHTGWPVIPGSSLKGILRDACREKKLENKNPGDSRNSADSDPMLMAVFGPPTTGGEAHAGALSITDARILAFPVRSLKGVFAWITCPAVLERLQRDMKLTEIKFDISWLTPADNEAIASMSLAIEGKIILEEFDFSIKDDNNRATLVEWLSNNIRPKDEALKKRLSASLVILSDNDFTHFVNMAIEVTARIGLDYETKTVKDSALFYEEFLPPETIFYALTLATNSRSSETKSARDVLDYLDNNKPEVIQIGADETIGKGLCSIQLVKGGSHAEP